MGKWNLMEAFQTFLMTKGYGGKGGGKGKGGCQAKGTGNFVKDELVSQIKAFQRSSEEHKQIWWAFCDSQGGGNRDPARHDEDVLQAFLTEQGIQVAQGSKDQNFIKGELINKIKAFQRSSEEQKKAWWAFCDRNEGHRDPARYEADVLQVFIAENGIQGVQGSGEQKRVLVAKIKGFQKSGEEQKQAWWAFCDAQGSKKRDPALHEVDILEAFVQENGI